MFTSLNSCKLKQILIKNEGHALTTLAIHVFATDVRVIGQIRIFLNTDTTKSAIVSLKVSPESPQQCCQSG